MEDIKMFSYGLNNMNMYGMNTMSFGNMGMFNMGGINMFGNMFGSSIFTNCDGSYNYDAMAGFGVGQVLMNIGGLMLGKVCANAQANSKKTLSANVDNLDTQIYDIETEMQGYTEEKTELETAKSTAQSNLDKYESELNSLKATETKAKNTMETAYTALQSATDENKAELRTAYDTAVEEYNKAVAARKAKGEEIAEQEAIINENKANIEALAEKIEACEEELEALIAERDAIQAQLNEKILDKADGIRTTRTSLEEFEQKDFTKEETQATKQDMRRAIAEYRTASPEKKEDLKKKIEQIYNKLDAEDKNKDIRMAYEIICGD